LVFASLLAPFAIGCRATPLDFPDAPVVLVSIDTLRADHLPAYGYSGVETPHLDRFRKDAVLFASVWSPSPMTLPSHVSMLTGLLPPEHGVRNNVGYVFDGKAHASLPRLLEERGYTTGAAVSSYVLRRETGLGELFGFYEDSLEASRGEGVAEMQRPGGVTARRAAAWLDDRGTRPFFFLFHIYEPHVPYDPPEPFRSRFAHPYDGEIAAADAIVGELFDRLRARGLYDRSIVIVTSDHGEGLGDHGEDQHSILLYVEAVRVPLLVKLPRSLLGGRTVETPASLVDIAPTVLDLLGIDRPLGGRGVSLRRLVEGDAPERTLYGETLYPRIQLGWSELKSVTDGRWHYIHSPRPELYDLAADPHEKRDLITQEPSRAGALRAELARVPKGEDTMGAADPAAAERLAALGYVGTARERGPSETLPNPVDSLRHLDRLRDGFRLAGQRRYGEAAPVLRGVVREAPPLVEAWIRLGEVLVELGRPDEAVAAFDQALARSGVVLPDVVLSRGYAHLKARRPAEAEADAERARPALAAGAEELRVRIALFRDRLDDAERQAREVVRLKPHPSSTLLLAEVLVRRGQLKAAEQALDEAAREAAAQELPRVRGLEALRADVLARSGRLAEAEEAYLREIRAFPDNLLAYANLAALRFAQGRRKESDAILETLVEENPHPQAYVTGATALEAFGRREDAARFRARAR
jgi:arylsulfatase A-like enzyme/tetratricopeptide (TPR) repeat protein